ncbi:MAG: cytochrome c [Pseudohongiellaceae bacterium]
MGAQQGNALRNGIFSQDQAERGAEAYGQHCSACHANDLLGNATSPPLAGMGFLFLWEGRPLAELFEQIRRNMPTNAPASLPEQEYADILAYLLARNGFPAGGQTLTPLLLSQAELTINAPN